MEYAFDQLEKRIDKLEDRLSDDLREVRGTLNHLMIAIIGGFFTVVVALIALLS